MSSIAVNNIDRLEISDNTDASHLYYCAVFGEEIWVIDGDKQIYREHIAEPITEQELKRFSNELTRAVGEEKICSDTDLPNEWKSDKRPIETIEHTRVTGKHIDTGEIIIEVLGEHYVDTPEKEKTGEGTLHECKPAKSLTETISKHVAISPEKAERQLEVIDELLNMPAVNVTEATCISSFRSDSVPTPDDVAETIADKNPPVEYELWIEPVDVPDDVDLSEASSIKLENYEIGCDTSEEHQLYDDLQYNINGEFDGKVFTLESPENLVPMGYTCLLTEWVLDEEGDVENIVIPNPPYDEGHLKLPPGTYRAWNEVHEITDNDNTSGDKTDDTEQTND